MWCWAAIDLDCWGWALLDRFVARLFGFLSPSVWSSSGSGPIFLALAIYAISAKKKIGREREEKMERCTLRPALAQHALSKPRRGLAFAHMLRITTLLMHTCTTYETERTSSWQKGVLATSRHGKLSSHPHAVMTLLHVARPSPDPPLSSPTSASTTIPTLAECRPGKMSPWQKVVQATGRHIPPTCRSPATFPTLFPTRHHSRHHLHHH